MKRPQLVSAGSLNRMIKAAAEAEQCRDFSKCIEILERAGRLAPANHGILLDLGGVYGKRYNYAAAAQCFDKAIRVAPKKLEAFVAAGHQCREFNNYEMAEHYLRRATEQKEATPEVFVKLAELYERLRRTDEAAGLIDRALQSNGACAAALLARARLDRQAGHLESAEKLLRSFLPAAEKEINVRGWYELGGILDRQERYDEAMSAFLEAKAILRADAPPHTVRLKTMRIRLDELRTSLTTETLQRWFDRARELQPPHRLALLAGHPRSGTTLLEQVLDSHPDIVSAEETEIFHDDACVTLLRALPDNVPILTALESATTGSLLRSRENYFHSMELSLGNPVGGRLLVDKNPILTFLIPALIRIFPEVKLLVALRDPRDVCLSCFMQPLFPIRQTSSAYLNLESTVEEYAALMGMWTTLALMIKNPWLEVRYEDMVNDLKSASRRVLDFLNVPWDERVLRFDEHARQKLVRSPTYAEVTKPVFKTAIGRWRHYQKYLEPYLDKLAPFVKKFGYD
jgi:tetratricopeptide (TPR) repeat protein